MVESQEIRDGFCRRLHTALDEMPGIRPSRGRNTDFHAALVRNGFTIKVQATHKWLSGESKPDDSHVRLLAKWLGVRTEWLEYGVGSMRETPSFDHDAMVEKEERRDERRIARAKALVAVASTRSREVVARIVRAAEEGRLTESDLNLLDTITARLEAGPEQPEWKRWKSVGVYSQLREKLTSEDSDT